MVSRDQLLKYGALLLIVVFVGETLFLGLSNAASNNPDNAATPTPVSFSSSANATGTVQYLAFAALAVCDASTGVDKALKNVSGVRTALFASSGVLAVQLEANATLDPVEAMVAERCGAPLYRSAGIDLPSQLYFNTSSGEQAVSSRQLDAYFSAQGVNGFQAFVSPRLRVGDKVNVTVYLAVEDDRFASVSAQQPEAEMLALLASRATDVLPLSAESAASQNASLTNASPINESG